MYRIYRKRVYPVREVELPWIKRARTKELRSIIGSDVPVIQTFELGMLEYVMLILMYECSISNLVYYLDMVVRHGAILVSISYIFITVTLTMPLNMLLTFLGSYSKKSYIGFFCCAPVFEGLGYVVAAVKTLSELYNSTTASVSMLIFYHCITSSFKATFCKGLVKIEYGIEYCLTMHPVTPYNFTCDGPEVKVLTATQYYIRKAVTQYDIFSTSVVPTMSLPLLNTQIAIWMAIFLTAINGIKRLRAITMNLQFIFGTVTSFIVILSLFHGHSRSATQANIFGKTSSWISFDFWSEMILFTVDAKGFGSFIWLAAIKPKALDPKFAVIVTSQIKLVIFSLTACMSAMIYQENLLHYMIEDSRCLPITGFDVIFCLIPDVLYRTGIHKLIIPMWYMGLFYFGFVTPLYTVIGLVDSITQRFRRLNRYKLYVCAVICATLFLLNLCLILDIGGYVSTIWKTCSLPLVASLLLLLVNVALFFVYSNKNIVDDYLFTYGQPPENYWLIFWKTSPIFSIFTFIFVGYNQYGKDLCSQMDYVVFLSYGYSFVLFLPVVALGIMNCCAHVRKTTEVENISKLSNEWGPYNITDRENRKLYYPQREIRYRTTTLVCKHRCCCAYPTGYLKRCRIEHEKLAKLEVLYEEENVTVSSSSEDENLTASIISTDSSIR